MGLYDLVPGDESEAARNIDKMTAAFLAKQTLTVDVPGTYYFDGTAETPFTVGCGRIKCDGCFGYAVGGHPTLTGQMVRFNQLASATPLLRINGTGFIFEGGCEMSGDGFASAIEVVGNNSIVATGRHRFYNLMFTNWARAFDCLAGWYNNGVFVPDENHADNCCVMDCATYDSPILFRSQNQQSVNWTFDRCLVEQVTLLNEQIVADIRRGGMCAFNNLVINHPNCTIFRVQDYSPNNCQLTCRDFVRDRFDFPAQHLTLVDYQGSTLGEWSVDISGWCPTFLTPFPLNRLFNVPSTLPRKSWRIHVGGLPAF